MPGSNATAKTPSLAADLYALPERPALGLELYGNTVIAASLTPEHGTEQSLTAGTDYTVLEAAVSSEDAVARYALLCVPYTLPKGKTAQAPALVQDDTPLVFAHDTTNAQLTARVRANGTLCASLSARQSLFADVVQGAWYANAAAALSRAGLLHGVAPDTFDPRGSLTRGMLLAVLWRLEGKPQAKPPAFLMYATGRGMRTQFIGRAKSAWSAAMETGASVHLTPLPGRN